MVKIVHMLAMMMMRCGIPPRRVDVTDRHVIIAVCYYYYHIYEFSNN